MIFTLHASLYVEYVTQMHLKVGSGKPLDSGKKPAVFYQIIPLVSMQFSIKMDKIKIFGLFFIIYLRKRISSLIRIEKDEEKAWNHNVAGWSYIQWVQLKVHSV